MEHKYWIDEDGYLAHDIGVFLDTVGGPLADEHIEPLTQILESHNDLLELANAFFTWHGNHFEEFDEEINDQLLFLANLAEQAIAKATA